MAEIVCRPEWVDRNQLKTVNPVLHRDLLDWLKCNRISANIKYPYSPEGLNPQTYVIKPVEEYSGYDWEYTHDEVIVIDDYDQAILFKLTWC